MLLQILAHTPTWVFGVFALLLWLGARQMRHNQASLARVAVMPVVMAGLSGWGVISAFGHAAAPLAGWAMAALGLAVITVLRPVPRGVRYDAAARSFQLPGSAMPLALMMGIFFTKYLVGVLLALHPALAHGFDFSLSVGSLYGAFTGVFVGRAMRLWRIAFTGDAHDRLEAGVQA